MLISFTGRTAPGGGARRRMNAKGPGFVETPLLDNRSGYPAQ